MAQFYNVPGGQAPGGYGSRGGAPSADQFGGSNAQQPNIFGGGLSPEMLNLGLNAGRNMLNAQRDQWMPGVSVFWSSLKIYFAV
jgi:hypothetical protein